MKKFLMGEIKIGVKTTWKGGVLSLPASDLLTGLYWLASLFCSLVELAERLLQEFFQAWNLRAITIEI